MKFPLFTLFMIFIGWFTFRRLAADRKNEKMQNKFWEQEDAANATRRQDISQLPYIQIDPEEFPLELCPEDATLARCQREFQELSGKKMLNLSNMTNTQLKLKYGAPNLPLLMEYDNDYTSLICLLQEWGSRLYELGYRKEAEHVLHAAVSFGSDIKGTFTLLATIYQENKNHTGFAQLKQYAKLVRTLQKENILQALDAMDTYREVISVPEPALSIEDTAKENLPGKDTTGPKLPSEDFPWAGLFEDDNPGTDQAGSI